MGPRDNAEVAELFAQYFHRGTMLDGEDLLVAADSERDLEYLDLARIQKFHFTAKVVKDMDRMELLQSIVPPGKFQRYKMWIEHLDKVYDRESVMFDVDHHCETKGGMAGPDWPVSLRHGCVLNLHRGTDGKFDPTSWRLAVGKEHLSALGYHLYADSLGSFPRSKMGPIFDSLPSSSL
jgi:hypothetical protein